ncbi:MAG: DUF1343 domain-containing protein [Verrucomicrobiota bacterium]
MRRVLSKLQVGAFWLALCTILAPSINAARIHLGIDVLEQGGFRAIAGKRVGLLTHPAGVNRIGESSIDVLRRAPNVHLVALFGPEHGIYGNEKANVPIQNKIDARTGLPVFSLYGDYRKPTPEMLRNLDALVVDLQDVGVRSYTYVSCMRYAMEACFQQGVEVVILDRPNPLGGLKVDGPSLDREWRSYVGAFHVPYVHGLTIAELARIAKNTSGWMNIPDDVRRRGKLSIIPMRGWHRDMLWPDTGLKWTPTSPYVPDLSAVLGYAMTGLGAQEGGFSHGIGTPYPFRLLRHEGKSAAQVKRALEARSIPGLSFRIVQTQSAAGAPVEGVYVSVHDWSAVRPTEISFHMMQITEAWTPGNTFAEASNPGLFNKHVGSTAWWNEISQRGSRARVSYFVEGWAKNAFRFRESAKRFWIY